MQTLLILGSVLQVPVPTVMETAEVTSNSEAIQTGCDITETVQHWVQQQPGYLELLQVNFMHDAHV